MGSITTRMIGVDLVKIYPSESENLQAFVDIMRSMGKSTQGTG